MTKIYVDVSNLMHVSYVSGIQRVVREVVLRLLEKREYEICLLQYLEQENRFGMLSADKFQSYYGKQTGEKAGILGNERIGIDEFSHGDIFLELDNVWHTKCNRMVLYPELKAKGVRIAVFLHDIIPVMWPQYAAESTVASFLGYIVACVSYGDWFISSTQANLDYLHDFMKQIGVENNAPCTVSWLGMDFGGGKEQNVQKRVKGIADGGKYLLMVGTVEPRKNHKLVLDAMDAVLYERGWRLVISGRRGWKVEALEERIRKHPQLGRQLFWIEDAADSDLAYLYAHARFVVFPSFAEGFGLPIVEAFSRGVPVLSADCPVMKEVGGSFCRYFSAADPGSLVRTLEAADGEQEYESCKEAVRRYPFVSWEQVCDRFAAALSELGRSKLNPAARQKLLQASMQLKQMVILSARADDFLRSVPFIEAFMPFIQEIVLCCPDRMEEEVRSGYSGRLKIHYLTDGRILGGMPLPEDHAARNIFLRSMALRHDIIDQVFLMGDDDYRPLQMIDREIFCCGGKHIAYYVKDIRDWKGTQGSKTSFDVSMDKCRDFLTEQRLPTYMFDAHMPQIICKSFFLEMLEKYPQIMEGAASEWSGYFNYVLAAYPDMVEVRPYVTMDWPGFPEDWDTQTTRDEYLFENFYDVVYEDRVVYRKPGHFRTFSKEYHPRIFEENQQKAAICLEEQKRHGRMREVYDDWCRKYALSYGMQPVFAVCSMEGKLSVVTPSAMPMVAEDFLRIDFTLMLPGEEPEEWQLTWGIYENEAAVMPMGSARFSAADQSFQVLLMAPEKAGEYRVEWNLFSRHGHVVEQMMIEVEELS